MEKLRKEIEYHRKFESMDVKQTKLHELLTACWKECTV